ncbi:hypothetical protein ACFO9Q_12240 [Paenibacillus sp. GCM10023252]|uniref:hypothetical protein n=1 Tax=Paenibacillus sp. GCM10023252 TaxID=3252649 RepID=UPI00361840AB
MSIARGMATALMTTMAAVLLISLLPHGEWKSPAQREEISVFRNMPYKRIGNDNLVDAMVSLQLSERLTKVEWKSAVLSVDVRVDSGASQPERWFADVEKLIRLSFLHMENVNRLLVRFVEYKPNAGAGSMNSHTAMRLLFAADIRKSDQWLADSLDGMKEADPIHSELWRKRLRLSFTSAWNERFGKVTPYTATPSDSK